MPVSRERRRGDRSVSLGSLLSPFRFWRSFFMPELGSPGLPDMPHAGRTAEDAARSQVDAMIARVEQRLRSAPDDGNGWDVIGPVYLRMERYGQAAEAFANANRLLGETPKRLAGFVQAEILANNGIVNPNAKTAAERLLALEPDRLDARMWLALAKEQDGQFAEALADYRALIKAPQMTPAMTAAIEVRISAVERLARGETVEPPASGGMSSGTVPGGGDAIRRGRAAGDDRGYGGAAGWTARNGW